MFAKLLKFLMFMLLDVRGEAGGDGGSPDDGGGAGGSPDGGGSDIVWPEGLDANYHGDPTLLKYVDKGTNQIDVNKALVGLVHANKMIGADKVLKPRDSWDADQWKDFYQQTGVPASLEDYAVENNLPEGIQANEDLYTGFKQTAHELGLRPNQAQGLLDYYNNALGEGMKQQQEHYAKVDKEAKEALETEWADAYEKNTHMASEALKNFTDTAEEFEAVKEVLKDPALAKVFKRIADGLGEDSFTQDVGNTFGLTAAEIDEQMATIYSQITDKGNVANKKELKNKFDKLAAQKSNLKAKNRARQMAGTV